jgi:hypothetical protein
MVTNIRKYCIFSYPGLGLITRSPICQLPNVMHGWRYSGSFFAIDFNIMKEIPNGMILVCIRTNKKFPYNTHSISIQLDIFNLHDDCMYLLIWTTPVPNTIPLYVYGHKNQSGVVPTFEYNKKRPNTRKSPFYVLSENGFRSDMFGNPLFMFTNIQGRCIPNPSSGYDFDDCLQSVRNDTIIKSNKQWTLINYLTDIVDQKQMMLSLDSDKIDKIVIGQTISSAFIVTIGILFIISILIV